MLNRRSFIASSAAALGAAAFSGRSAYAQAGLTLDFTGWNYDNDLVNAIMREFEAQNPGTTVAFTADPAGQYNQKLLARFIGGDSPDALFTREETMSDWAESGFIRPLTEFDGLKELVETVKPNSRNSMTYKGEIWALPYYTDHIAFMYNADLLDKAGISAPPTTWDELLAQSKKIMAAGLLPHPLVVPMKGNSALYWWAAIYGMGGGLFDETGAPRFGSGPSDSLRLLEFLVDAGKQGVLDQASLQMGSPELRQAFMAGQVAFAPAPRFDLKLFNDPGKSTVAGNVKQMLFPGFDAGGPHGTLGWTHLYSVAAKTDHAEAAWNLIRHISSPASQKRLYLRNGVGYSYAALDTDAEIAAETNRWSDQTIAVRQGESAKPRETLAYVWGTEWEINHMEQVQEAIVGRKTPAEALEASAATARRLNGG